MKKHNNQCKTELHLKKHILRSQFDLFLKPKFEKDKAFIPEFSINRSNRVDLFRLETSYKYDGFYKERINVYTIVELKKGLATDKELFQLLRYVSEAMKLTFRNNSFVKTYFHAYLIANDFDLSIATNEMLFLDHNVLIEFVKYEFRKNKFDFYNYNSNRERGLIYDNYDLIELN